MVPRFIAAWFQCSLKVCKFIHAYPVSKQAGRTGVFLGFHKQDDEYGVDSDGFRTSCSVKKEASGNEGE